MSESENAGKYQVDNDGSVQGQVIGDHATVNQHFLTNTQPDRAQDQNRLRFLTYLSTRYRDVLEQSLQGAALLALGLHTKPEAIAHPAHLVFRHLNQSERVLPPGTSLSEVYDQAGGDLLILGEPGAGKSTLLVHMAQDLLIRAERDQEHLLPVIFNLSSWAQKRRSLDEWLVDELLMSYQVPRKVGKLWVQEGCLLALFDGLDEVAPSARSLCIDAINTYRKAHLVPLVVCSRTIEYFSQEHRLELQNAVVVQPLTTEQIDDYLDVAGSQLVAVRRALKMNKVLRELAVSPLMLNVLTLTYRDASVSDLPVSGSVEEQQREVFASYIKRMLATNKTGQKRRSQQMLSRLIWLARQMQRHNQTVFYLEQLQPSWLSSERLIQIYKLWAIRLPGIVIGVLLTLTLFLSFFGFSFSGSSFMLWLFLGGLLGGILSRGSVSHQSRARGRKTDRFLWQSLFQWLSIGALIGVSIGLIFWLSVGWIVGLSFGLIFGCSALLLQVLLRTNSQTSSSSTGSQIASFFSWQSLIRGTPSYNGILALLLLGLSVGLSFGVSVGVGVGLSRGLSVVLRVALRVGLSVGLSYGLGFGLVGAVLSVLLVGRSPEIQSVDRLVWSWKSLRKSFFLKWHRRISLWSFMLFGLGYGLSYQLNAGPRYGLRYGLSVGLSLGVSVGLINWLLLGLFEGISSETVEHQQRILPNQGISRSLSNGLILGFISTAIVGLISCIFYILSFGLSFGLNYGMNFGLMGSGLLISSGLSFGLVTGLGIGLIAALLNGGLVYFQHYTLRFLLWRKGSISWKLPQLLDEAARHILLRKIGGGYVFIHRLFLDYMASLETSSPLPLETSNQQASHQSIDNSNEEHKAT